MMHDLLPESVSHAEADEVPDVSPPVEEAAGVDPAMDPPPPVLPDPAPVLLEVGGDTGIILYCALRDVLLWGTAPMDQRADVFGRGAGPIRRASLGRVALPPDLAVPVELMADLVESPTGTHALLVTHACLRVAQHLCRRGAGLAALAFAQAAALVSADHPRPLLEVGRLLGPAHAEEARVWLHRAAAAAEAKGEGELIAQVHAELAALAFRRNDRHVARGHVLAAARGLRRSRR